MGSIVNFDALDPDWTMNFILDFKYDEKIGEIMYQKNNTVINDQMILSDYRTYNTILNSGGIFITVMFYLFLVQVNVLVKIKIRILKARLKKEES